MLATKQRWLPRQLRPETSRSLSLLEGLLPPYREYAIIKTWNVSSKPIKAGGIKTRGY